MPESYPPSPDSPLWQFALSLYARAGVPEATLALQDCGATNVGFALACLWLAQRGVDPVAAREAIQRAHAETARFHVQVVEPVRAARRAFKPMLEALPTPLRQTGADLRKQLARDELALEQLEYRLLYEALRRLPAAAAGDARACFAHYLSAAGIELNAAAEAAFAQLVESAARAVPANLAE